MAFLEDPFCDKNGLSPPQRQLLWRGFQSSSVLSQSFSYLKYTLCTLVRSQVFFRPQPLVGSLGRREWPSTASHNGRDSWSDSKGSPDLRGESSCWLPDISMITSNRIPKPVNRNYERPF